MRCPSCGTDMQLRDSINGEFYFCPRQYQCGQKTITKNPIRYIAPMKITKEKNPYCIDRRDKYTMSTGFCPHCGTPDGMSFGTGDCGCEGEY